MQEDHSLPPADCLGKRLVDGSRPSRPAQPKRAGSPRCRHRGSPTSVSPLERPAGSDAGRSPSRPSARRHRVSASAARSACGLSALPTADEHECSDTSRPSSHRPITRCSLACSRRSARPPPPCGGPCRSGVPDESAAGSDALTTTRAALGIAGWAGCTRPSRGPLVVLVVGASACGSPLPLDLHRAVTSRDDLLVEVANVERVIVICHVGPPAARVSGVQAYLRQLSSGLRL